MAKRKVNKASMVESHWKVLFDKAESSRLRRAKVTAKQGVVKGVTVSDKVIVATVKLGRTGNFRVQVPAVDWWATFLDEVAIWLSRRPDWLAALYAKTWNDEFLEFVTQAGLSLFPQPSTVDEWISGVRCTCSDREPLCPHVLTLVYHLVWEMQSNPLAAFTYVGLDVEKLLSSAKAHSVVAARALFGRITTPPALQVNLSWQQEEDICLGRAETETKPVLRHRIAPEVLLNPWTTWKKTYMTWE